MTTTVMPSASLLGVIASPEALPGLGAEAPVPESAGAFAQVLAAIEGEAADVPASPQPESPALPSAIEALPMLPPPPETHVAIPEDITTLAPLQGVTLPTIEIPPRVAATPTDDASIETAPVVPTTTIADLPEPTDMQPITPPAEMTTPLRRELVRAATPAEVAPSAEDPEWTPIVETMLAEAELPSARPTEARDVPREPIAVDGCDEPPSPDAVIVAAPSLPPPPPVELAASEDVFVVPPETQEDDVDVDVDVDAPPSAAPDVIVPPHVAPPPREPVAIVRDAPPKPELEARAPESDAPTIDVAASAKREPAQPRIGDAPPQIETRTAASEPTATRRTAPPSFALPTPAAPAPSRASTSAAPKTSDAPAVLSSDSAPQVAPRLPATPEPTHIAERVATPEPTRVTTPTFDATPKLEAMPSLDAMPTNEAAAREAPTLDAPTTTTTIDTPARAPIDAPPKPPIVLARAEDLALAIEELRPIPKGGATVEVEAPGLGAIRLHVAVDGDTVKIRIHAGSDALAWFAREHDGLCSAARQAVPESQSVDLQLQTGSDSRGNQSQPHARTYASEDAPQPQRMRAPTPKSEATPTSTSPRSLVDVLA